MLLATVASAHTHLESSVPADKSRVGAPSAIELRFSETTRVTSLTLQHGTAAARSLAVSAKPGNHVSVPVSGLTPGDYKVNWRVAGEDGHVVSGSFVFTVDPAAAAPGASDEKAAPAAEHQHQH
jgi:methionine-rich copper-binding protein CopC